jgi:hypothetical protein
VVPSLCADNSTACMWWLAEALTRDLIPRYIKGRLLLFVEA